MELLAAEAFERHKNAFQTGCDTLILRDAGKYHWRAGGEKHVNDPASIASLQESALSKNRNAYNRFVESTMESVIVMSSRKASCTTVWLLFVGERLFTTWPF